VPQWNRSHTVSRVALTFAMVAWAAVIGARGAVVAGQATDTRPAVMPQYDAERNLRLPSDYRQWILVGQSLGLSYSEGGGGGHQMFNTTLMEPTAYRHFVETGQFREGTMLALILQAIGTNALPARQGQFATEVHVIEMAVKDKGRVPEGWAYYQFGGPMSGGYLPAAAPQPKASCYSCHVDHAARDNVFMQFYGLLKEAAPQGR
jgi:Cytochrome P460